MPNFIDINQINKDELHAILASAKALKQQLKSGNTHALLQGKQLAMIFEKPSTRTRVSFEAGISQLGGNSIIMSSTETQIKRGEPISDTAKVLSRYVDIIMMRCFSHESLLELANNASIPVINGLTDFSHPCQVMADIMTFEEHRSPITGKKIAWIGDGNNMTHSWIHAAAQLEFSLHIATPENYKPEETVLNWAKKAKADIHWTTCAHTAVKEADLVTTDTWVSMGDKDSDQRLQAFAPYQVNSSLMQEAKENALFMHCLPAHRGQEVTEEVIDAPDSIVFDEAENRLHIQKAIMAWCLK